LFKARQSKGGPFYASAALKQQPLNTVPAPIVLGIFIQKRYNSFK